MEYYLLYSNTINYYITIHLTLEFIVVTSNVCIDDVARQEGWHGRVWV